MDLPKALGILGFEDTQWLSKSELTPKEELDNAHHVKMMALLEKKKEEAKESNDKSKNPKKYGRRKRKELRADDEFRILHEAYQFLLKKYNLGTNIVSEAPSIKTALDQVLKEATDDKSDGNFILLCSNNIIAVHLYLFEWSTRGIESTGRNRRKSIEFTKISRKCQN